MELQSGMQWRPKVLGNGDMEAIAIALRWEHQALSAQCNRRMVSCYLVSPHWFWRLHIVGPDFRVSLELVQCTRSPWPEPLGLTCPKSILSRAFKHKLCQSCCCINSYKQGSRDDQAVRFISTPWHRSTVPINRHLWHQRWMMGTQQGVIHLFIVERKIACYS